MGSFVEMSDAERKYVSRKLKEIQQGLEGNTYTSEMFRLPTIT